MAKPPVLKTESTMELSGSDFVPEPPPLRKPQVGPQNDRSAWGKVVVGTDDFAPATTPNKSRTAWLVIGGLAVVILAVGGLVVYRMMGDDEVNATVEPTTPSPAATPPPAPTKSAPAAVVKPDSPAPVKAVVEPPPATVDAVVPAPPAIVKPAITKPAVKQPVRKPIVKKKPAVKPKRR